MKIAGIIKWISRPDMDISLHDKSTWWETVLIVHAVCFPNGKVWDAYNGWRPDWMYKDRNPYEHLISTFDLHPNGGTRTGRKLWAKGK